MLALWLMISPFVFRYPGDQPGLWWHDFIVATKCSGATGPRSWDRGLSRKHLTEQCHHSLRRRPSPCRWRLRRR